MAERLFPTTVVGSFPQPAWLVDHAALKARLVPRIRAPEIWRVAPALLNEALDDATLLAIRAQERAGIDIITDGEMRRESYSNQFGTALDGLDLDNPYIREVREFRIPMPRIVGPLQRTGPVAVDDFRFLRKHTDRLTKATLPGPFTLSKQARDDYYDDPAAVALAYADIVNAEARDLAAAGADVIQLDEPWLREDPEGANAYGVSAINRALAGLECQTCIHLCFGYGFVVGPDKPKAYRFLEQLADCSVNQVSIEAAQPELDLGVLKNLTDKTIVLGVIDLSTNEVESAAVLSARIRRALPYVDAERLMPAPDCGMKYLARDAAEAKLTNLAVAAEGLRADHA